MKTDGLARSGDMIADAPKPGRPGEAMPSAPARPLGGRRISFLAWGLAALAGILIWALIFRLI